MGCCRPKARYTLGCAKYCRNSCLCMRCNSMSCSPQFAVFVLPVHSQLPDAARLVWCGCAALGPDNSLPGWPFVSNGTWPLSSMSTVESQLLHASTLVSQHQILGLMMQARQCSVVQGMQAGISLHVVSLWRRNVLIKHVIRLSCQTCRCGTFMHCGVPSHPEDTGLVAK